MTNHYTSLNLLLLAPLAPHGTMCMHFDCQALQLLHDSSPADTQGLQKGVNSQPDGLFPIPSPLRKQSPVWTRVLLHATAVA